MAHPQPDIDTKERDQGKAQIQKKNKGYLSLETSLRPQRRASLAGLVRKMKDEICTK